LFGTRSRTALVQQPQDLIEGHAIGQRIVGLLRERAATHRRGNGDDQ
jgi:hypothetical protein